MYSPERPENGVERLLHDDYSQLDNFHNQTALFFRRKIN